jgi:GDPmannose 4,6-dehydratase
MWLMMQQKTPDDYVIATGKTHSVRDFLIAALAVANLKGEPEDYVIIDETLKRPSEVDLLIGDAIKARNKLGWEPEVDFKQLVSKMVNFDLGNH